MSNNTKNVIILESGKNICPEEIETEVQYTLDYIKEVVKSSGLDKKWDDIVKDLILFDGKYYKLFINEQDMDTLLYSINSYLGAYSVLSDEDKEKLRAYM